MAASSTKSTRRGQADLKCWCKLCRSCQRWSLARYGRRPRGVLYFLFFPRFPSPHGPLIIDEISRLTALSWSRSSCWHGTWGPLDPGSGAASAHFYWHQDLQCCRSWDLSHCVCDRPALGRTHTLSLEISKPELSWHAAVTADRTCCFLILFWFCIC